MVLDRGAARTLDHRKIESAKKNVGGSNASPRGDKVVRWPSATGVSARRMTGGLLPCELPILAQRRCAIPVPATGAASGSQRAEQGCWPLLPHVSCPSCGTLTSSAGPRLGLRPKRHQLASHVGLSRAKVTQNVRLLLPNPRFPFLSGPESIVNMKPGQQRSMPTSPLASQSSSHVLLILNVLISSTSQEVTTSWALTVVSQS
ncbi:hypothetical protein VTK26DRAFT_5728 [Humicola hyalothermophila]